MRFTTEDYRKLGDHATSMTTGERAPTAVWATLLGLLGDEEIRASHVEHVYPEPGNEGVSWCITAVTETRLLAVEAVNDAQSWDSDTDQHDKRPSPYSKMMGRSFLLRDLASVEVVDMEIKGDDDYAFTYRLRFRDSEFAVHLPRTRKIARHYQERATCDALAAILLRSGA